MPRGHDKNKIEFLMALQELIERYEKRSGKRLKELTVRREQGVEGEYVGSESLTVSIKAE